MKNIVEAMNWRYATKKFDVTKKLSKEQLADLLDATRLSPSSFGLPTWKIVVVENPETRMALQSAAYGQTQVVDASNVLVFAIEKNIDEALVDQYIVNVSETRGVPAEQLAGYANMMKGSIAGKNQEARKEWAKKQAYIGLGVLLAAAACEEIDTCPMEGFDSIKFDEILELNEKGLESCVMVTLGFRAEDDVVVKKVRPMMEAFIVRN